MDPRVAAGPRWSRAAHGPNILGIVRPFRWGVLGVFSLVVVQQVAWIVEPTVFGHVIDALIGQGRGASFAALLVHMTVWATVFAVNTTAGTVRRIQGERVFSRLFTHICTTLAATGRAQGVPPARTLARAELSRDLVTFLQSRIPDLISGAINIAGSLVALSLFDWRIGATCLLLGIPLAFINRISARRIAALQATIHDRREGAFETFATGDPEGVRSYFAGIGAEQQRVAGWGALNFGVLRAVLLGIFVVVLYISVDLDGFTTGSIYSVVSYLWTYVAYSEDIPLLIESWSSMGDLSRRLRA